MENEGLVTLSNVLVTSDQLQKAQENGCPPDLELSLHFQAAKLTQSAGILLKLPQETIAQSIVLLQRFYTGGGSFGHDSLKDFSAAALYLTAKISFFPQTTRDLLNVYACLTSRVELTKLAGDATVYTLSEGEYMTARQKLMESESRILQALAFDTSVVLPYTLALTYLQTLALLPPKPTEKSHALVRRVIAHLNSALLSPQLLYLTHQPNALAVAAIYLAARETGFKISDEQWWHVWDVDREELGFLVVSFGSLEGFVKREMELWRDRSIPLNAQEANAAIAENKKHDRD